MATQEAKDQWLQHGRGRELRDKLTRDSAALRQSTETAITHVQAELTRVLPALERDEHAAAAAVNVAQKALDLARADEGRVRQATMTARQDAGRAERRLREQLGVSLGELEVAHRRELDESWAAHKRSRAGMTAA